MLKCFVCRHIHTAEEEKTNSLSNISQNMLYVYSVMAVEWDKIKVWCYFHFEYKMTDFQFDALLFLSLKRNPNTPTKREYTDIPWKINGFNTYYTYKMFHFWHAALCQLCNAILIRISLKHFQIETVIFSFYLCIVGTY